jgi:hypothetical protein
MNGNPSKNPNLLSKRPPMAGFRIGILIMDSGHDLLPGNVQHADSFGFPVVYEVVRGITLPALMRGDPSIAPAIIESALALQACGVSAVVGACGSFANYQLEVAAALEVPAFMSIMLEVPLLLQALPSAQKLGIIFAKSSSFTQRVRDNCGINSIDRVVAIGMDEVPEFAPILASLGAVDDPALRKAIVDLAQATIRVEPRVGAWLLQCSDLPPYAAALRAATGLPVFDMVGLIQHVHAAIARSEYAR